MSPSVPTAVEIVRALREPVPEFEREAWWPMTIVFDAFADHVSDRVRAQAPEEEREPLPDLARRAMGFAEWLAEHGREDLAERAVSPLFDAVTAGHVGAGPRTVELLRRR